MKLIIPASTLFVAVFTSALVQLPVAAQSWPPEIRNLKVLPADTPANDVMVQMREFALGLGVRCQYCHVGQEGQPIHEFDFASDVKPTKERARHMLRMTRAINDQHLAGLPVGSAGATADRLQVQCVTCHRGASRPEQLQDVLARTLTSEGTTAALAKYDELRDSYYGSGTFDFGELSLVRAAERLAADHPEGAVALLDKNLEHHAESVLTLGTLAGFYEKLGRRTEALDTWKRILELQPGDPRVQAQIERLEQGGGE